MQRSIVVLQCSAAAGIVPPTGLKLASDLPVTFFGLGFLILLKTETDPSSRAASCSISIISLNDEY